MSDEMIPVEEVFAEWRKHPDYRDAYESLDEEFAMAAAMIRARTVAQVSQEEIARQMETSQPAVARLEAGRGNPSLKTLRRYAAATGTRLNIVFEPLSGLQPSPDPRPEPGGS